MEMESAKESTTTSSDVNSAGVSGGAQTASGDAGATASQNVNQQQAAQPPTPQQQQMYAAQSAVASPIAKANARGGGAAGNGGEKKGKAGAGAKKNARANDAAGIGMSKKPSPRARTPKASKAGADGGDAGAGKKKMTAAEKKKAAAAVAAQNNTLAVTQNTAQPTQPTNEKQYNPTATGPTAPGNGGQMNAANSNSELLPVHDNELRKSYLQQIYRQLLVTHRNQDDNIIRQVATNVEMEVCKKATSRSEYIATLNYEINKLMQKQLANGGGNAAFGNAAAEAPGVNFGGYRNSESASTPTPGTAPGKSSTPQSRASGYAGNQSLDHMRPQAHSQGHGVPPTQSSEGSFMQSLLSEQNPASTYAQSKGHPQTGTPVYSSMGVTSQHGSQLSANRGYAQNAQGPPQTPTNMHMQQVYQQQQQQPQRQSRPLSPGATIAEFAAQLQHFDKNALIELLWNQRNSLIHWQRRAAQLEAAFNARYNSGSPAVSSSYYNSTPTGMQSYGSSVSPAVSAEVELQRANDRRNGRMVHQQQHQYPGQQPPYAGGNAESPMSATGGGMGAPVSPMMYWEKVRNLKSAYSQDLYLAHRALSQHNAPPNSSQSIKAENVKHNITLAMNVLNEPPKNIQPRPFEVLTSIERFIHSTIIPIVQKVGPGMRSQQSNNPGAGSPSYPSSSAQNPSTSVGFSYTAGMGIPSMPGNGKFYQGNAMQQGNGVPLQVAAQAAQDSNPSAAGSRGKKTKSEQVGSQRMPPQSNARPKPSNPEGKSTAKKGSKAKEAKPAAAPPSSHHSISDGHQSPFAAGLSAMDKMSTPTVSPSDNRMMAPAEDSVKSMSSDAANKSMADNADDDALNDFSDFPELDFDEEMPSMKVQFNKENNSYNTKKRSIEDV